MPDQTRVATPIDRIADAWVDRVVSLSPEFATSIGRTEHSDRHDDSSPAGIEAMTRAARETLKQVREAEVVDEVDRVTQTDLIRDLEVRIELHDAQWHLRDLNVLTSAAHSIRSIYDLMPTGNEADWAVISRRLGTVTQALQGFTETLAKGRARGIVPAARQVGEVAVQMQRYADDFFTSFVASSEGTVSAALRRDLDRAAAEASAGFAAFAGYLRDNLYPAATPRDAVGRDLYALHSRRFLGAAVDLDETYEWGVEELARMVAEQQAIARDIVPGGSVAEAIAFLEQDASRKLHGTAALQEWMQATSDRAVAELADAHFDIPDALRTLECMIAPTQEGGIYYTAPADDFSRPGRMWWSVPEGVTTFDTWRELTTVYHEGVPGHHLQIGQQVYARDTLNSWRRLLAGTSGHFEGWALYAERLMESLGYLDDPADRLGMLDGQRMRAARVVLDIGVHLEKPRLDGTGTWDADYALEFMLANVNMPRQFVEFEVDRYLGWPGQAPAYKVGQRIWEQLRDDVARREGESFSLRDFHSRTLALGSVGLDTLRSAVLGSSPRTKTEVLKVE